MSGKVYQFKMNLVEAKPPIWRRFQVYADITFEELHYIIQTVMEWGDNHLWAFTIPGVKGVITPDLEEAESDDKDPQETVLSDLVKEEKATIMYEYDFGDSWLHELKLEKILEPEDGKFYPNCEMGMGAGPLENVGGIWGYMRVLEALKNPKDDEHKEVKRWFKEMEMEDYDPSYFDASEVSAWLRELYED
ncbi:plasmid pRiA4b ORF-3 family protein [Limibacter armeniacum]|uniref:plasmid pRiA4b ORF-3 family protein n=1 Tax=Limibacter armeniacum TaxID=466084 RepID=UPI002FE60B3F